MVDQAVVKATRQIQQLGRLAQWHGALLSFLALGLRVDLVASSAAIAACARGAAWLVALGLLAVGLRADVVVYGAGVRACEAASAWRASQELFGGLEDLTPNLVVYNELLSAYSKVGRWEQSCRLLAEMDRHLRRDLVSYNSFAKALSKGNQWREALQLLSAPLSLDVITFSCMIDACADRWRMALGLLGVDADLIACNAAISACAKASQWARALSLLDSLPRRALRPSGISFNAVMAALEGQWQRAETVLRELQKHVEADVVSFNSLLSACETSSQWQRALLWLDLLEGISDVISYSTAASACEKSGEWQHAKELLGRCEGSRLRGDVILYSTVISACGKRAEATQALALFTELRALKLRSDVSSYNAVMSCGTWRDALHLLHDMPRQGLSGTVVSTGSAIAALGSRWRTTLQLLQLRMVSEEPDKLIAYNTALRAQVNWRYSQHLLKDLWLLRANVLSLAFGLEAFEKRAEKQASACLNELSALGLRQLAAISHAGKKLGVRGNKSLAEAIMEMKRQERDNRAGL